MAIANVQRIVALGLVGVSSLALSACDKKDGGTATPGGASAAPVASAVVPPPAIATPAPVPTAAKLACRSFTVENAKGDRGAPLWASSDGVGVSATNPAMSHVPVGQKVSAACKVTLGGKGFALCVRDAAGEVGWLHHERVLEKNDPAAGLGRVRSLDDCKAGACAAAECQ